MKRRLAIWIGVAAAAAAAVGFAPGDDIAVQPVQALAPKDSGTVAAAARPPRDTAPPVPRVLAIRSRETFPQGSNPFRAPPAVPVREPAAMRAAPSPADAAAPEPPPLPFHVLGRFVDEGRIAVFMMHGGETLAARVGDTLAGVYRVEGIAPSALTLNYLPLQRTQTLPLPPPP